jgi:hypothetical protein
MTRPSVRNDQEQGDAYHNARSILSSCQYGELCVTVIGEVGAPRVIPVTTEKMIFIESLASAGDLALWKAYQRVALRETLPERSLPHHKPHDAQLSTHHKTTAQNDIKTRANS